jgi:hypothetical protein
MNKLIINNQSDLDDLDAWRLIELVVGRISNNGKQYCRATIAKVGGVEYAVYTHMNKMSDKFTIIGYNGEN